jgi:Flp pilus assembly protein TadD
LEQDDTTEAGSEALTRARAMIKARDWAGAERLLATLVKREDEPMVTRLLYSRTLQRRGKMEEALAVARETAADHPRNSRAQAQLANSLIKAARFGDAERLLAQLTAEFPEDAKLHALHAEASLKAGEAAGALKAIENARRIDPHEPDNVLLEVVALALAGKSGRAHKLIRSENTDSRRLGSYFHDVILAYGKSGRKDEAMSLAEAACSLMPEAVALRAYWADRLIAAGKPKEALAALDANTVARETMTPDHASRFIKGRARALQVLGERDEAIAEYKAALAIDADDEDALRELYVLSQQLGRTDEMRSYGRRLSSAGAKSMPATLADGLAAISGAGKAKIGDAKLEWAWEIADKTRWQRDEWLKAVEWGRKADLLLRAWWLNMPERSGEIDALIDRPGANGALESLPQGARCLIVTTHLGPMAGNVRYMQTCGRPFRGFGFSGPDPVTGEGPPMRIAANRANPAASLRALVEEIEKGTAIGFAQDSPDHNASLTLDFLGRRIAMSTLVPRLIAKHDAAGVWCQALWRNKRIAIETGRLPDPEPGEPVDAFCKRWCDAYLAKIAPVMQGAPENLTLGQGIWVNAEPSFGRRRSMGEEA